jgi:hypothetical protein
MKLVYKCLHCGLAQALYYDGNLNPPPSSSEVLGLAYSDMSSTDKISRGCRPFKPHVCAPHAALGVAQLVAVIEE